jgi:Cof subfamily protein (haloacid dehalogenase superfamily)
MGKFTGVLLASDFDNTLIHTEPALRTAEPIPPLSEGNRKALEYFMAEGGRFAVATGRALAAFQRYVDVVPMNTPGIVCNGAALYDFGQEAYLETAMLEGEIRQRGQAVLDRFPAVAVEAYHIQNVIHAVHPNEITRNHEHLTKVGITELPSLLDAPLPLGKLLFEADHETLQQVKQYLDEMGWSEDYELIFSMPTLLELTARGARKGDMVCRLAKRLGISMEHVYCVGDEANDLSMLQVAAEGFAPANCSAVVRESGATIVAHCNEDAIAEVIAILDRNYS